MILLHANYFSKAEDLDRNGCISSSMTAYKYKCNAV